MKTRRQPLSGNLAFAAIIRDEPVIRPVFFYRYPVSGIRYPVSGKLAFAANIRDEPVIRLVFFYGYPAYTGYLSRGIRGPAGFTAR